MQYNSFQLKFTKLYSMLTNQPLSFLFTQSPSMSTLNNVDALDEGTIDTSEPACAVDQRKELEFVKGTSCKHPTTLSVLRGATQRSATFLYNCLDIAALIGWFSHFSSNKHFDQASVTALKLCFQLIARLAVIGKQTLDPKIRKLLPTTVKECLRRDKFAFIVPPLDSGDDVSHFESFFAYAIKEDSGMDVSLDTQTAPIWKYHQKYTAFKKEVAERYNKKNGKPTSKEMKVALDKYKVQVYGSAEVAKQMQEKMQEKKRENLKRKLAAERLALENAQKKPFAAGVVVRSEKKPAALQKSLQNDLMQKQHQQLMKYWGERKQSLESQLSAIHQRLLDGLDDWEYEIYQEQLTTVNAKLEECLKEQPASPDSWPAVARNIDFTDAATLSDVDDSGGQPMTEEQLSDFLKTTKNIK